MARVNLLFQVQTHLSEKFNLAWEDTLERVVYTELRGREELYKVSNEKESMEIFWLNKICF